MHACNHQLVGQTSTNLLPTALTLQLQYLTVYVYHKGNSTTVYTATVTTQDMLGCKKKVNSIKHHIFYRPGQLCLEIMSLLLVTNLISWFRYCGKSFLSNKLRICTDNDGWESFSSYSWYNSNGSQIALQMFDSKGQCVGIKAMELHVILQPVKSLLNAVLPEYLVII